MSSEWWDRPVRVMIDNSTAYNVNTNAQAAELLLGDDWPVKGSVRHVQAQNAVLRSMERPSDPGTLYVARQAFEVAAREADILVER